jgi:hypothetical protein
MGSATYRFVLSDGSTRYSNFASSEEAALQAQADLESGRVVRIDIFDTSALPDLGQRETPAVTAASEYDETTLPSEADLLTALGA